MLAGECEAEVAVVRTAGVADEARVDAATQQGGCESRGVRGAGGENGDDGGGGVRKVEAGGLERDFHAPDILGESLSETGTGPDEAEGGESGGGEWQGEGGAGGKLAAGRDDAFGDRAGGEDDSAVGAEGFAECTGLDQAPGAHPAVLRSAASRGAEDPDAMGVVEDEPTLGREGVKKGRQGSDCSRAGEKAVGEDQGAGSRSESTHAGTEVGGVGVSERRYGASEVAGCVEEAGMGSRIDKDAVDVAGERLGDHGVGGVATGQQHRLVGLEEAGEGGFELGVEGVVAGGGAGGGHVQPETGQGIAGGSEDRGMAGEAVVVAASEVEESSAPVADIDAVDLFELGSHVSAE